VANNFLIQASIYSTTNAIVAFNVITTVHVGYSENVVA
jgi:hypothetical protein